MPCSRGDQPSSSTHDHTNKHCQGQLICKFIHSLLSPCISMSFVIFQSHFLSGTMLHFHTLLLALHSFCKQSLSGLKEISCSNLTPSLNLTHLHLVVQPHHPSPPLTLSPRYLNCLTVSTSSHSFSFCSTACPIFPSYFLHV